MLVSGGGERQAPLPPPSTLLTVPSGGPKPFDRPDSSNTSHPHRQRTLSGSAPHYVQANRGLKSGLGSRTPCKETNEPLKKDSKPAGMPTMTQEQTGKDANAPNQLDTKTTRARSGHISGPAPAQHPAPNQLRIHWGTKGDDKLASGLQLAQVDRDGNSSGPCAGP